MRFRLYRRLSYRRRRVFCSNRIGKTLKAVILPKLHNPLRQCGRTRIHRSDIQTGRPTQSELLAWLTGIVSIFDWGYYLLCYINVNFNRADTFFLVVIPVGFYVLTLIYTALRYSGLLAYYSREAVGAARARGSITQLRFLVVHDNSIYLGPDDPEQSHPRLDTPYSLTIHYCKDIPIELVKDHFCNLAQAQDATIKYIYTSESGNLDGTIRHYIATIGNKTDIDGTLY